MSTTRRTPATGYELGRAERRKALARPRKSPADDNAVLSFVIGLPGLLVFNLFFGPLAAVYAIMALAGSTTRRGLALLGLFLGVADLVVLAVLVTADGTISWSAG